MEMGLHTLYTYIEVVSWDLLNIEGPCPLGLPEILAAAHMILIDLLCSSFRQGSPYRKSPNSFLHVVSCWFHVPKKATVSYTCSLYIHIYTHTRIIYIHTHRASRFQGSPVGNPGASSTVQTARAFYGSFRELGALFGSPCNEDRHIFGSIFGALCNHPYDVIEPFYKYLANYGVRDPRVPVSWNMTVPNPTPKEEGTPAYIVLHPCSNFLESSVISRIRSS